MLNCNRREPIAITGIGLRFPGADNVTAFWQLLRDGVDAVSEVPAERWSLQDISNDLTQEQRSAVRYGGFIRDIDRFDAAFFGISAKEAISLDPKQRLVLETAWQAIEDAGIPQNKLSGSKTGVYVGTSVYDYYQLLTADVRNVDGYLGTGNFNCVTANRLSYFLDLKGPSIAVETACSASLTAIQLACQAIYDGGCEQALVGGAMVMLCPEVTESFARGNFLAPDGRCKAFDDRANGYVRGEGAAMVMLKPLSKALEDNDRIYATILSAVCNQDGRSNGLTAPNPLSQQAILSEACERAAIDPSDISYVETHGTGTRLGDPMEIKSLGAVYGKGRAADRPCRIGSVKTNIGHLEAAAGVAGFIKAALSIYHGHIPASLHYEKPNALIPFSDLGMKVQKNFEPWPDYARPRLAGVSSFSFGGSNTHVILSEAPAVVQPFNEGDLLPDIVVLSAKTEAALNANFRQMADYAQTVANADLIYSLNKGRTAFRHRLATVVSKRDGLPLRDQWVQADAQTVKPKVAFLFTGQGAQFPGMVTNLYARFSVFRQHFKQCVELMNEWLDEDIYHLSCHCPEKVINNTRYTQPMLFAFEYALASLWLSWGIRPTVMLGHSIGEYSAACIAGVIELEFACELVCERARYMSDLPSDGGMLSVFCNQERLDELLPDELDIAAFNAPERIVIAGNRKKLMRFARLLKSKGINSKKLSVSHAFHSRLLEPVLDNLRNVANAGEYATPHIPVISNVTGLPYSVSEIDADYWARHARSPVLFADGVDYLAELGVDTLIEVGPGKTLLTLVAECGAISNARMLPSIQSDGAVDTVLHSLAELFVRGIDVNWNNYFQDDRRQMSSLPNYPFDRERHWLRFDSARSSQQIPTSTPSSVGALLGQRVITAGREIVYSCRLDMELIKLFYDHQVFGKPVLPATAIIDMLYAAAMDLGHEPDTVELQSLEFKTPLSLPASDQEDKVVQLVLNPTNAGFQVEFYSADGPVNGITKWHSHTSAEIVCGIRRPLIKAEVLTDLRLLCNKKLDVAEFYKAYAERGIEYGQAFRRVISLYGASTPDGENVVGLIQLNGSKGTPMPTWHSGNLHPVLLDCCLQLIGGFNLPQTYVPAALGVVRSNRELPDVIWCHVRRQQSIYLDKPFSCTATLYSQQGKPLAVLEQLVLAPASPEQWCGEDRLASNYYLTRWQQAVQFAPSDTTTPNQAVLARQAHVLAERFDFAGYYAGLQALEQLSAQAIAITFERIFGSGAVLDNQSWKQHISSVYGAPLFNRYISILLEHGMAKCISVDASQYILDDVSSVDLSEAASKISMSFPQIEAEAELVAGCGATLQGVLCGDSDPLQTLFSKQGQAHLNSIYREGSAAHFFGGLIRSSVNDILDNIPNGRGVRILELGAGTGGTTAHLLPALPSERVQYTFTDISPVFIEQARSQFKGFDFIDYHVLDIEQPIALNSAIYGKYDLVIASNVLHATKSLDETLDNVSKLLTASGVLILQEVTSPQAWLDLTFGLTPGWWRFQDARKDQAYPLLNVSSWIEQLEASGFNEAEVYAPSETNYQHVMIAQKCVSVSETRQRTILNFDSSLVGSIIRENPEFSAGVTKVDCSNFIGDSKTHASEINFEPLRRKLNASPENCDEVFICMDQDDPVVENNKMIHFASCFLKVMEFLLQRYQDDLPRIYLVTRNAQAVVAGDQVSGYQYAALWGMARTWIQEHPGYSLTCIDLDENNSLIQLNLLLAEYDCEDNEDHIAYRGGVRLAARLQLADLPSPIAVSQQTCKLRKQSGRVDGLHLAPITRCKPLATQVEIQVHSAGLNFLDLLDSLDSLPFERVDGLGAECVGLIVRKGSAVNHVAVGERVAAIASGALTEFVTTDAQLVVPIPDDLSDRDAAALGVVYLTASLALLEIAKLKSKDDILVHAAAGATGLAAVNLAIATGARVFATASPEKWPLLYKMGVEKCFHSRNTGFLDGVLSATSGRGVDVVLNSLTSPGFIEASLYVLADEGRFVELAKHNIYSASQVQTIRADVDYQIVDLYVQVQNKPEYLSPILVKVLNQVSKGKLLTLPVRSWPVWQAPAAFRHLQQARNVGKVVLEWSDALKVTRHGLKLSAENAYLITGGLGGLGLAIAGWMSAKGAGCIWLLGRSDQDKSTEDRLDGMRARGCDIRVIKADVTDKTEFTRALKQIKGDRNYPLSGVIHAVGVLADGVWSSQSPTSLDRVMSPKITGGKILVDTLFDCELDFLLLFSSIAGLFGSAGQANHAAANAVLDSFAAYLREQGFNAKSINWGAWSEIGAAADKGADNRMQHTGLGAITPDVGIAALERALTYDGAQLAFVPVDWNVASEENRFGRAFFDNLRVIKQSKVVEAATLDIASRLSNCASHERTEILEHYICVEVATVLGFNQQQVDLNQGFTDIGIDSLTSVELRNRLQSTFNLRLPSTLLFDYPNIGTLVEYLIGEKLDFFELNNSDQDSAAFGDRFQEGKDQEMDESTSNELLATQLAERLALAEQA